MIYLIFDQCLIYNYDFRIHRQDTENAKNTIF